MILSYMRTIVLYAALILAIRLMGKRQIGQMEPSEFVVAMLVADLVAIPMQNNAVPLINGLVPMLTVMGLELILSHLSLRSIRLRKILCGKPVILIENGQMLQKNLRKTCVTVDELMGHLRQKDVLEVSAVQYAIMETDGNLSVFPYPQERPASAREAGVSVQRQYLPVTIIEDGCLLRKNLAVAGKDETWLQRVLAQHGATVDSTWLLTVDGRDHIRHYPKEERG